MSKLQLLTKGIIRENPTFVLLLGMCPTLGTTTSAVNGMGMGLATLFVLTLSNVVISLVKNLIPAQVRIPSFIVVIAAFVTVVQLCMEAYTPDLYNTLGVYIPLIVVNCIILGRAEAFASKKRARLGYGRTGHRIGVHAFSDGDRRSTGDARQRSDIRHEIHPWRRNAVVYPGSGSIHRTGLPAGAVQ